MVIFDENRKIFSGLQIAQYFRFEKPEVALGFVIVSSDPVCRAFLQSRPDYKVSWGSAIDFLVQVGAENYERSFILSSDDLQNARSRELMGIALYSGTKSTHATKSLVGDHSDGLSTGRSTLQQNGELKEKKIVVRRMMDQSRAPIRRQIMPVILRRKMDPGSEVIL
jgi:hypothetical protein